MDLILDGSVVVPLTISREVVNLFHTNLNLTGHSETKCVIAKVKQPKSNAAGDVTFPVTQENNDSTSEQLPAMKL